MGARDLYLSWPAVSHISNFTVVLSSSEMVCVKKAAPIVLSRSVPQTSAHSFPQILCPRGGSSFGEIAPGTRKSSSGNTHSRRIDPTQYKPSIVTAAGMDTDLYKSENKGALFVCVRPWTLLLISRRTFPTADSPTQLLATTLPYLLICSSREAGSHTE